MENITPYILVSVGILISVNTWLFTQSIGHTKEIVELRTAFRFYLERTGIDGAKILAGSTNPTPPEMQALLNRYPHALENGERQRLRAWLMSLMHDPEATKGERSIALHLLATMDTLAQLSTREERGK